MSPVRQVEHEVTSVYQQEGQLLADEVVAFAISRKIHRQALLSSICRVVSSHANKHGLVEGASAHHFREARRCAPTQTTTELVRRQSASSQNCILLLYIYNIFYVKRPLPNRPHSLISTCSSIHRYFQMSNCSAQGTL